MQPSSKNYILIIIIRYFLDTDVKLSEPDKEGCEGPLSLDECTLVLKMMKNGTLTTSDIGWRFGV